LPLAVGPISKIAGGDFAGWRGAAGVAPASKAEGGRRKEEVSAGAAGAKAGVLAGAAGFRAFGFAARRGAEAFFRAVFGLIFFFFAVTSNGSRVTSHFS
jgi:hypothetical protein